MKISDATAMDVAFVAWNMREQDQREFMALSHFNDQAGLATDLGQRFVTAAPICAFLEEEPVAIGACFELRPNVISLGFFATDKFPSVAIALTRFIKDRLLPEYKKAGVHRIECLSIEGNDSAHRWLNTLGLSKEASFPGYGKAGETFHQFAWVA